MPDFAALREDYRHAILDESDVDPDPIRQFSLWFDQALSAGLKEANAMALATATRDGVPAVRMVLLKGFDEHGFVFQQLRKPEGPRTGAKPAGCALFLLDGVGAAGTYLRRRHGNHPGRVGCLFRFPPARKPDQRRRISTERRSGQSPRTGIGRERHGCGISGRRCSSAEKLGRLSIASRLDRVLAGQAKPAA